MALFVAIALYGQRTADIIAAARYSPSPEIARVSERLQYSGYGQTLFYASDPQIEDQTTLNESCLSTERTAAMLGCYYLRKIHLFDIKNPELDGAVEVTAAHEMLHAAYDRLNFFERQRVDALISEQYQLIKDEPYIKQLMEYYTKAEPGSDMNELHSIIGTTTAEISDELERYYGQYFKDRQIIVAMNTRYNQIFRSVEAEANQLAERINSEAERIQYDLEAYDAARKQLEQDISSFNERASGGGFGSQGAFVTARGALVARINQLNGERDAINARVDAYNRDVEALKALSVRHEQLNQSINGVTAPATEL